ncbi:asparaginase [Nocardia sp. NPDC058633]|uniref:asparaginase n=1 Tax=Nocardia sp. NPDC058633 TaxID=3346568 RepID=UPI00366294DA
MVAEYSAGRVVIFGLGGTIAMSTAPSGGVAPSLTADALVAAVPGLAESGIDVEVVQFRQLPGASLTFHDIQELCAVMVLRAESATGFVVTQGTDTIEETSYLIDLLHALDHPVVVTGAMRNPTMAGADGPANLLAAINLAADQVARGLGCLVVLDDQIHAASRVRKQHSTSTGTFGSLDGGPLGYVVEGKPRLVNTVRRPGTVPTKLIGVQRVPIFTAALGDGVYLLRAMASQIDGLVVAAMGVGHVPAVMVDALAELAAEVPVVLSSRTGSGPVLRSTYGFPGSERDLISRGLIPAGFLNPLKARILLSSALSSGVDIDTIRQAFAVAGGDGNAKWPWARALDEEDDARS